MAMVTREVMPKPGPHPSNQPYQKMRQGWQPGLYNCGDCGDPHGAGAVRKQAHGHGQGGRGSWADLRGNVSGSPSTLPLSFVNLKT